MRHLVASRIAVDAAIRSGKPVVDGTRVPVELVVGKLAGGMTVDEVADDIELAVEDVLVALRYAASILAREDVRVTA